MQDTKLALYRSLLDYCERKQLDSVEVMDSIRERMMDEEFVGVVQLCLDREYTEPEDLHVHLKAVLKQEGLKQSNKKRTRDGKLTVNQQHGEVERIVQIPPPIPPRLNQDVGDGPSSSTKEKSVICGGEFEHLFRTGQRRNAIDARAHEEEGANTPERALDMDEISSTGSSSDESATNSSDERKEDDDDDDEVYGSAERARTKEREKVAPKVHTKQVMLKGRDARIYNTRCWTFVLEFRREVTDDGAGRLCTKHPKTTTKIMYILGDVHPPGVKGNGIKNYCRDVLIVADATLCDRKWLKKHARWTFGAHEKCPNSKYFNVHEVRGVDDWKSMTDRMIPSSMVDLKQRLQEEIEDFCPS